jgi:hypothetical protein
MEEVCKPAPNDNCTFELLLNTLCHLKTCIKKLVFNYTGELYEKRNSWIWNVHQKQQQKKVQLTAFTTTNYCYQNTICTEKKLLQSIQKPQENCYKD